MPRVEDATLIEIEEMMGGALTDEPDAARLDVWQDQILKRTWEELEAIEQNDSIYFPEKLWRRKANGKFEAEKVTVRVPRLPEMRAARAEAKKIAAEDGIDPKLDPIEFENLEDVCILARAVRNSTAPFEQLHPDPRVFEKKYDEASLTQLKVKMGAYKELLDPRPAKITREQFIATIAAVAERRDISPLRVIAGSAANSCIVTMASLLHSLMTRQPSSPSSESSTPEHSATENSTSSEAEGD
jgi:hypothetical protein